MDTISQNAHTSRAEGEQPKRKRQRQERQPVPRAAYQISEFLEAFGVSRSHLYNLIRDGKIRSVCIGGRRLIPVEEGQRLLEQGAR
jgi:excisionase family DNA binding protein